MQNNQFFNLSLIISLLFNLTLASGQISESIEWTDCFLNDCSGLDNYPNVKFGYLTVPENYEKPAKRPLKIAFAIIKATDKNPKPDPIVRFTGGRGRTILNSVAGYAQYYRIKDRDLVLFDYRGTGYSEPKLCDRIGELAWEDIKDNLTYETFQKNQTKRFNQCLDSLELRGIDFDQYGSNTKTKDAVRLAEALSYKSVNLFGASYGTRAILNFIRNAEQSNLKIRSATMDASSPIGGVLHQGYWTDTYTDVLSNILKDCENDPTCNKAFPNLKERFIQYLQSLETEPWEMPLEDGTTLTLSKEEMNANIHQLLYEESRFKYIPILLEHYINKDHTVFNLMLSQSERNVKLSYNAVGLINYVYDNKHDLQETKVKYAEDLKKNSPFTVMDGYIDFYLKDNRIGTDSLEQVPLKSNVPSLFLVGTYDPITPVAWTDFTASGFPNKFYFKFPRIGHVVSNSADSDCGWSMFKSFIDNPKERPESTCLKYFGENPIPFKTSYYNNSKIGLLLKKINERNVLLIALLLFISIVSVINIVLLFKDLVKRSANKSPNFGLASLLIILFGVGLTVMISKTMSTEQFLLLFGLIEQANYVFYLSVLILIVGLIQVFDWVRNSKKTKWSYVSLMSLLLFVAVVANYNLFPNF